MPSVRPKFSPYWKHSVSQSTLPFNSLNPLLPYLPLLSNRNLLHQKPFRPIFTQRKMASCLTISGGGLGISVPPAFSPLPNTTLQFLLPPVLLTYLRRLLPSTPVPLGAGTFVRLANAPSWLPQTSAPSWYRRPAGDPTVLTRCHLCNLNGLPSFEFFPINPTMIPT